jgi:hypothetical protein
LAKLALAVAGSVSVAGNAVATPAAPASEPASQSEVPQVPAAGQPAIPSSPPVAEPAQPPLTPSRPAVAQPAPPVAKSHTYRGFRDTSGLDRPQTEFAADLAKCDMYGTQMYFQNLRTQQMFNPYGNPGLLGIGLSFFAKQQAIKQCMMAQSWQYTK